VPTYIYECTYCIWFEVHKEKKEGLKCPICGADMVLSAVKD